MLALLALIAFVVGLVKLGTFATWPAWLLLGLIFLAAENVIVSTGYNYPWRRRT